VLKQNVLEAASGHVYWFLKSDGHCDKKSAENCQPQRLSETLLYEYLQDLGKIGRNSEVS
jgi:hypothetical protein